MSSKMLHFKMENLILLLNMIPKTTLFGSHELNIDSLTHCISVSFRTNTNMATYFVEYVSDKSSLLTWEQ